MPSPGYFAPKGSAPPKAGAFKLVKTPTGAGSTKLSPSKPQHTPHSEWSHFRILYDRGDFPISVNHDTNGNKINWKVPIDQLDYHHYLPLFFSGLSEVEEPYAFLARQGVQDMLAQGKGKVVQVVPQLILPIKSSLLCFLHCLAHTNSIWRRGVEQP